MHVASECGYEKIVKYLVENGADVNIKDKDGKTPLEVAEKESIATYLEEHS